MKQTMDAWFMSFLLYKGVDLKSYEVDNKGRIRGSFDLTEDQWREFKMEFSQTEFVKFKMQLDKIKSLGR